jgi:NTP pyrophosphatase (non-canonical NTP hydrolase)
VVVINSDLKAAILKFRQERDWQQFHNPRNLAAAISIEAAELLEPFRWSSDGEVEQVAQNRKKEIADEIADLVILLTYLANDLSISLDDAVGAKLAANAIKYPVEKFRGSSRKYSHP